MIRNGLPSARGLIPGVVWMCSIAAVSGCVQGRHHELTSVRPYADLIGTEYRVVADDLHAYGIYDDPSGKKLGWVTLIPGIGISGREIAFRRHVRKGETIRISSAWRRRALFESGDYYLVRVHSSDLPRDIPIRVELFRGNEGDGVDLNPRVYSKLQRHR